MFRMRRFWTSPSWYLRRHCGKPRRAVRAVFLAVALLIVLIFWDNITFSLFGRLRTVSESETQTWTCPACYGTDFCSRAKNVRLEPRLGSYLTLALKGVSFGHLFTKTGDDFDEELVVVKSLGSSKELRDADQAICRLRHGDGCAGGKSIGESTLLLAQTLKALDKAQKIEPFVQRITAAVRTDRRPNVGFCQSDRLWFNLGAAADSNKDGRLSAEEGAQLMTQLLVNGEVTLFRAFPSFGGFPFPKVLGACGRLVFEEYCGEPINTLLDKPWLQRVRLALSVILAVLTLTENDQKFVFHLLDLNMENFAMAENGVTVKLIDGEHVLVSEVFGEEEDVGHSFLAKDGKPSRESPDSTCPDDTPQCQSFDSEVMCDGHYHDHNYLYTCKNLLLGSFRRDSDGEIVNWDGILHSPPQGIRAELSSLLRRCVFLTQPGMRFDAFHSLIRFLEEQQPAEFVEMPQNARFSSDHDDDKKEERSYDDN